MMMMMMMMMTMTMTMTMTIIDDDDDDDFDCYNLLYRMLIALGYHITYDPQYTSNHRLKTQKLSVKSVPR